MRYHHHRHVLVVPWIGAGIIPVEGRRFRLSPGQALLILPFQFHHRFRVARDPILWQLITFELRSPGMLEPMRSHPRRPLGADDWPLLSAFIRAWAAPDSRNGELASWLSLLLSRLLRAPSGRGKDKIPSPVSPKSLLTRINRECMPRLDEIFGLKDLATRLSISESHLRARFRQETGISLGQHLRRLRLQKAMGLLAQSDFSVTQIAAHCGFDSIFTFSRSFRRFAGTSAKEYRHRCLLD